MPQKFTFLSILPWVIASCYGAPSLLADDRPNVILIVADDMGFSDLGSFGSEIDTPNLDAMAMRGVRFTNFHAAPSCSPTRAMLMSGCDNHTSGMGAMVEQTADEQKGKPGYEGHLNDRIAALPELLRDSGYHTYMTGKWHLGLTEELSPKARGFERSFALLLGGGSHFDMRGTTRGDVQEEDGEESGDEKTKREERKEERKVKRREGRPAYREDDKGINTLPEGFYSSRDYTDKLIGYIEENRQDEKPFFGWLAYTAPHWPLQAPDEFLAKYRGKYDDGFDMIREDRLNRMKQLGIIPQNYDNRAFMRTGAYWDQMSAEDRAVSARKMEVYSAMIDCMDFHIGRLVEYLKKTGEFENTCFVFMSDNGADAGDVDRPGMPFYEYVSTEADNSLENMGRPNSFISKGRSWAQACTAPYKLWKGFTTEGGIRVPALIYHPGMQRRGAVDHQLLTAMDIAPTILDLAKTKHPGTKYKDRDIAPIQGKSFAPLLNADREVHPDDEAIGWELHGRRAIFMGDYKATHYGRPFGSSDWELYNLMEDPGEINNLSQARPDLLQKMAASWDGYAEERGVVLIPDMPPGGGGRSGGGQGGRGNRMAQGGGQGRGGQGPGGQGRGPEQGQGAQGMGGQGQGGQGQRQGGGQGQRAGQQAGAAGGRQPLVAALDANGDLEITDAELRAAPQALMSLDANGNGQLDDNEFRAQRTNNTGGGNGGQAMAAAGPDTGGRGSARAAQTDGQRRPTPGYGGGKIYVKTGSRGDGSGWGAALGDLNTALAQAAPGDEIRVAAGTYYPSANGDRSASFVLAEGVTVLGGYSGNGDERDWQQFKTVLSGDIGKQGDDEDNSYHVVLGAKDAVLDGFTISGGNGTNAQRGGGRRGGGQGGPGQGGPGRQQGRPDGQRGPQGPPNGRRPQASMEDSSTAILVSLQQGQRGGQGQGRSGQGGPAQGRRQQGGPGQGGANQSGPRSGGQGGPGQRGGGPGGPGGGGPGGGGQPIHITPQMLLGNINPGGGAGIVNFKCAPTYRNCIIRDNKSRKGAGVYNMVATTTPADPDFTINPAATFINCSFINNYAVARGGAVSNDLGTEPTFLQCTFKDNKCDGKGGAMYNDFRCSPTMKYCLFVGNSAFDGGALGNDGSSSPTITNCTFYGNHAIDMGAALYQGSGPANNPIVTNTIIWGNTCDNGPAEIVNWHDNSPVVTFSCIEGGYFGDGNFDSDPLFVDADNGDFSLADDSPCIDKANGLAAPLTDRFDADRFDDVGIPDGPISSIVAAMGDLGKTARQGTAPADIGAFERQTSTQTARLKTVYVNAANQGQQDGRSWNTAFSTLQPAIELAYRTKAEVWVAAGSYLPTDNSDRTVSIQLRNDVALYGGFRGSERSRDERPEGIGSTILSGDIGMPDDSSDNSYHVIVGASGASLDGFVITEGNANGQAYHAKGGGMINYARHKQKAPTGWATGLTVHLSNCVFMKNTATEGGAVYNYDRSNPTFRNVLFRDNSAESGGAIVDRVGVKSQLTNCTFTNNYAKWRGGAVYFDYGSRPQIKDCTFTGNKTDGHGGASYIISRASQLENTIVSVSNSRFDGNEARLKGGGIANADSGVLEMTSVQFTNNKAGRGGGAVSNEYLSNTRATGLKFSGNSSTEGEADVETDDTSNAQINL